MNTWYFQGWEKRKDETGRVCFVYTGEHYTLPQGLRRAKLAGGLLTLGAVIAYGLVAFFPSAGGMWRVAAPAQLLEIIPLLYLCIGVGALLSKTEEKLTYRDWYASWHRMQNASLFAMLLAAVMVMVQLVYIIFISGGAALGIEFLYLVKELLCVGFAAVLWRYIRKHPCEITP